MRIGAEGVDQAFRLLRGIEALSGLDDPTLREIAALTGVVWAEAGTVIVQEGEPGDATFLVAAGRVELRVGDRPVEVLGPGRGIGLVQLLSGGLRTETAVAIEDTRLVRLSRSVFQQYAARHPAVERAVQEIVRMRVRALHLSALVERLVEDPAVRAELIAQVRWVELRRGEVLYRAGDPADAVYVVLGGRLRCDRDDGAPTEVGRGALQGEVSLLAGTPRGATVTAVRECLLARIDADTFAALLGRCPQLSLALARTVAARVVTARARPGGDRCCLHLAFFPVSRGFAVRRLVHALAEHLGTLGRAVVLDVDAVARHGVLDNADRLAADHPSWIRFQAWLDQVEAEASFVLYVCDPDAPGWSRRCVNGADRLVLVAAADGDPDPRGLAALGPRGEHDPKRVLALLHPPDVRRPTGTRRWLDAIPVDAHFHVRSGVLAEEARLARLLTGRAVGLTLGGGGARGLAHIGVIRAMQELGVPIDHVGGTSMGAIIAAQHAMGMSPDEMVALNRRLARLKPFSDYTLPVISLLRSRRIEASARFAFGTTEIEDLWLPYFAVSTNLTSASMVVHDQGPVWMATRASGSLPGIAVPVLASRQLLVDGGVLNNIPADVMGQRVGGQVVAVDVSPKLDQRFQLERLPGPWRVLRDRLAGARSPIPTIVDILLRTTTLASSQHTERIGRQVDLLLRPPVEQFGLLDFHRLGPIVDTGYAYAVDALTRWTGTRASA